MPLTLGIWRKEDDMVEPPAEVLLTALEKDSPGLADPEAAEVNAPEDEEVMFEEAVGALDAFEDDAEEALVEEALVLDVVLIP